MKNLHLDERTAHDIDERIRRIHGDLGYLGGKVSLFDVRDLLRLDIGYYAADDPSLLSEVVHKLKVGAKQVLGRPALLAEAIRNFDLKALFLPDRKRILIESTLPDIKKRWIEGHEVSHSVIPWHADYMLGDNRSTLSPSCHEQIEAEANYGAGRLLFPSDTFLQLRRSKNLDLAHVRRMAEHFGNSITSTLWRCIESDENPSFGVIGEHPRRPREGKSVVEYLIRSRSFEQWFSRFTEEEATSRLREYCKYGRAGPLGEAEIVISDDSGRQHVFLSETFGVSHHSLTLAQYLNPKKTQLAVPASLAIETT